MTKLGVQSETIKVKFDGQDHQVDLDTFTQVLLNYSTVVQAAAKEVGAVGDVQVAIKAIESGSLDVLVSIISAGLGGLLDFVTDNKDTIVAVTVVTAGLYEFKQKLAGKGKIVKTRQEGEENVVATTETGDVLVDKRVYNVYVNHPEATTAIDSSFSKLEEHPEIEAFELSSSDGVSFRAEHDEFSAISASANFEHENIQHKIIDNAVLHVTKPFLGVSKTRKWEFYYEGRKISAAIVDDDFMEHIGEYSFSVGTKMYATLDVEQEYLEQYRTFADKTYRVVKVASIDNPPQTESML